MENFDKLNAEFANADPLIILEYAAKSFGDKVGFATSMGAEDQILIQKLSTFSNQIKVFTLDTGRMFYETYDLIQMTKEKYEVEIKLYFPDNTEVEKMVSEKGINLFYDSIENRTQCCDIRKVRPLSRALKGLDAWITGLRKDQSVTRKNLDIFSWDDEHQMVKINPLLNWNEQMVWDYIHANKIPYNMLHDKGYPSIGCAPCTRAVERGENPRNGRWWWENPETKECGLHLHVKTS